MVSKTLNFYGQAAVVASVLEPILKQHELAFGWLNFAGAGLGLLLHVGAYILTPAAAEDDDA